MAGFKWKQEQATEADIGRLCRFTDMLPHAGCPNPGFEYGIFLGYDGPNNAICERGNGGHEIFTYVQAQEADDV